MALMKEGRSEVEGETLPQIPVPLWKLPECRAPNGGNVPDLTLPGKLDDEFTNCSAANARASEQCPVLLGIAIAHYRIQYSYLF